MITPAEQAYIVDNAYIPEHLPHYVTAISRTEPSLVGDYVVHTNGVQLIFVGYPLSVKYDETQMLESLDEAEARFRPSLISILAPTFSTTRKTFVSSPPDSYYRLDISQIEIPQKTRNMLTRAQREVSVRIGHFGREHKKLIDAFLQEKHLDEAARYIFQRVPEYVKCDTALVFEARNVRGDLVAFDVAELAARQYAFYMFNFRSRKHKIPGTSDLLLAHIIEQGRAAGKRFINLGLGINPGVAFFKKKWGAKPFLEHVTGVQDYRTQSPWSDVFDQLSRL